jgi:superfamily II DNA or RNA helicase
MELYEHQKNIMQLLPDKYLFAWGTGTGKSRTSIELVRLKGGTLLVICPKMLKENWEREIKKWGFEHQYMVISKEEFKLKFMKSPQRFSNVIVDEAHFFANYKSKQSKALDKYVREFRPRVYLLTATPYLSTPFNIYTLVRYLGLDVRFSTFQNLCFYKVKMAGRLVPLVKKGIEPYLNSLITSVGSVVKLEDCFDVPEQTDEIVTVKLTKKQIKAKEEITNWEPIVRFTKYHTIENGVQLADEYVPEDTYYENEKIEYIQNLLTEHKKIAVACRYNLQIEKYMQALTESGYVVYVINGATKDRQDVIDKVNKAESCVILINASCSEGYELPTIGTIVFASMSFSYKDYVQFRGRFLRSNALKKNLYIHLIVDGGVDEDVYQCIQNKQDFSFELLKNNKVTC